MLCATAQQRKPAWAQKALTAQMGEPLPLIKEEGILGVNRF